MNHPRPTVPVQVKFLARTSALVIAAAALTLAGPPRAARADDTREPQESTAAPLPPSPTPMPPPSARHDDDDDADETGRFLDVLAAAERRGRIVSGIGMFGSAVVSAGTGAIILADPAHADDKTYGSVLLALGGLSAVTGVLSLTGESASESLRNQYAEARRSGASGRSLVLQTNDALDTVASSYRRGRIVNAIVSGITTGLSIAFLVVNESDGTVNRSFNRIAFGGLTVASATNVVVALFPSQAEAMIEARKASTPNTSRVTIAPRVGWGSVGVIGTF
ncbi:MAG: hypothetical protein U0169_05630 [Polyangiaceae bacterium]